MSVIGSLDAVYDKETPGLYCHSHRSIYCTHVQEVVSQRADADVIGEVIGRSITPGKLKGEEFYVSLPIYPELCIWEVLSYQAVFHETLGPMAELVGHISDRHQVVHRILPGESVGDLAFSLRQNFEEDDTVNSSIELLKTMKARPGQPLPIPRCSSATHSMKYQRLLNEMFQFENIRDSWDQLREQTYGAMWTFHYYHQCVFCWTKRNMADAIRVAPDFAVEPTNDEDFSDLIPSPTPGRTDDTGRPFGASKW